MNPYAQRVKGPFPAILLPIVWQYLAGVTEQILGHSTSSPIGFHALVGVWRAPPRSRRVVYRDTSEIDWIERVSIVESTGITANERKRIGDAQRAAQELLKDSAYTLRFVLDVISARQEGLMPWGFRDV